MSRSSHPAPKSSSSTSMAELSSYDALDPESLGFTSIRYAKAGHARATIAFDRPEVLNAFDFGALRELSRAIEDASWDDAVRVIVLDGHGRARVLHRRRPQGAGAHRRAPLRLLEVDGRSSSRPTTGCATAASRRWPACDGLVRRRRQRVPHGLRPVRRQRPLGLPPRRPAARLRAGRRRDAVAARS